MTSRVYRAVANTPALDDRDARALADEIVDRLIDALQRDPTITFREWSLALAPLRAQIADRIHALINGRADLDEVLNTIEAVNW
jgi:hypothetical protein